jgi:AMMECR1 domain-containing protein
MLARPLREQERRSLARGLARALRQSATFSTPATAFVSLYERGRTIGCVGHADFASALRAARADPRFGGAREDTTLATTQLSLLVRGAIVDVDDAARSLELGTHGLVAIGDDDDVRAVLLPDVARDLGKDAPAMIAALAEKARVSPNHLGRVMLVRSERFVVRLGVKRIRARARPVDAAAAWLAARVDADGSIAYGVDARSGRVHRTGPFHLGRAAVVIEALAAHGGHAKTVRRARAWLSDAIASALAGDGEGMPRGAAERTATVALSVRAGVDARSVVGSLAARSAKEIASIAWHAAQVTAVLASETPTIVRDAALAPIDAGEWAPWSVVAARALGDARRMRAGLARLARSVPVRSPHRGGVRLASTAPEVAITALVAEVLEGSPAHRAARDRARDFVASQQLLDDDSMSAAIDPSLARGAFPLAPHADFLRTDVTAHALLALHADADD